MKLIADVFETLTVLYAEKVWFMKESSILYFWGPKYGPKYYKIWFSTVLRVH